MLIIACLSFDRFQLQVSVNYERPLRNCTDQHLLLLFLDYVESAYLLVKKQI